MDSAAARKARNRESAAASRERARVHTLALESEVAKLTAELARARTASARVVCECGRAALGTAAVAPSLSASGRSRPPAASARPRPAPLRPVDYLDHVRDDHRHNHADVGSSLDHAYHPIRPAPHEHALAVDSDSGWESSASCSQRRPAASAVDAFVALAAIRNSPAMAAAVARATRPPASTGSTADGSVASPPSSTVSAATSDLTSLAPLALPPPADDALAGSKRRSSVLVACAPAPASEPRAVRRCGGGGAPFLTTSSTTSLATPSPTLSSPSATAGLGVSLAPQLPSVCGVNKNNLPASSLDRAAHESAALVLARGFRAC